MGRVAFGAALLAGCVAGTASAVCETCHLRYWHKDESTPTTFSPLAACRQYADNSCCNDQTALNVHNGMLYGDDYKWDKCGPVSNACQEWFIAEQCLYECDVNAGKWRQHGQTNGTECETKDGWSMLGMPIKASEADAWYEACKDDMFAATAPYYSFFDVVTVTNATEQCRKFSDYYTGGEDMLHKLWSGAFVYDTNEAHAYTMAQFSEGEENPNNSIKPDRPFPEQCDSHDFDPDASTCDDTNAATTGAGSALAALVAAAAGALYA